MTLLVMLYVILMRPFGIFFLFFAVAPFSRMSFWYYLIIVARYVFFYRTIIELYQIVLFSKCMTNDSNKAFKLQRNKQYVGNGTAFAACYDHKPWLMVIFSMEKNMF